MIIFNNNNFEVSFLIQNMRLSVFVFIGFIVCQSNAFESVCKRLQVSTDIQTTKDDVVSNGVPLDKWNQNTSNIVI